MSSTVNSETQLNVLFVDDEIEILNALKRQMSLFNEFNGIFVNNPLEVMGILEKENIQIIVADVVMPEQDGITLLQEVKTKYPDITRILLTAYGDYNTSLRAINDAEVFGFITKPWAQDYLMGHLKMAKEMKEKNLKGKIQGQTPFTVIASWDDGSGMDLLYYTTEEETLASQFAKRVFLTSSALFGAKYRFQNNLFTLPLKESGVVVRGLLEHINGKNYGIFVFLADFDNDMRRDLDQVISVIEAKLYDDFEPSDFDTIIGNF